MPSDVDMDAHDSPPATSPSVATSRRSSVAIVETGGQNIANRNSNIVVRASPSSQQPISIPVLVHSPSPAPSSQDVGTGSALKSTAAGQSEARHTSDGPSSPPPTATTTTATTTTTKPVSSNKPRSSKPAKPRSPSPSPPPPPAIPLKTIRLNITLGGPSNYEVDISKQAKETGQRPPTPPVPVKKVQDSSDEEEEEAEDGTKKLKKKKRKNAGTDYYDTSDPFIDDSELALDERQYFAQTKQQGFYVSSGEVALLKDKTPKKPKSKKISFATGLPITQNTLKKDHLALTVPGSAPAASSSAHPLITPGTREAPIPVDIDDANRRNVPVHAPALALTLKLDSGVGIAADAEHVGQKRKRQNALPNPLDGNAKKKKIVDESLFHPQLQAGIKELRGLIAKESWENKGKFPTSLKPPLAQLAILAIRLDEYDDDFFSLMPTMFPYNKFTMTKLIKRTVFPDHLALLTERQDQLLAQLKIMADDGFEKAQEEWEKNLLAWDKRQEKIRHEAAEASTGTGTGSAAPTRHPTEEMDVDHPEIGGAGKDKDGKDKDQHPPAKRFRMTEQMKAIVWELVLLSNECCRLENEKNGLEGSVIQVSDQGLRKVLYQKIVGSFPDGWMTSGQISRDVSAMKKKLEKEAMEQDGD